MATVRIEVSEKLQKVYGDRSYKHTETINHGGTLIAFAMDENAHMYYAPLELDTGNKEKGEFDVAFWPEEPIPLPFPNEICEVGFSIAGTTNLPDIHMTSKEEKPTGSIESDKEKDSFLSTTARFTKMAPFRLFSDGKYIFVFRQTIAATHERNIFKLKSGECSASSSIPLNKFVLSQNRKVALVNQTLLCDLFVYVEGKLKQPREVRYKRSRHKTLPASKTDALGAKDMEGRPFYMPTHELSFIRYLDGRDFAVLQLPTLISGFNRWEIIVFNSATSRFDAFNMEVSKDGLFNLQGSQFYTSPDPGFQNAVLETTPGTCPFTNEPLIPRRVTSGHAETCLSIPDTNGCATGTMSNWRSTSFTLEMWVKPEGAAVGDGLFTSHTSSRAGLICIDVNDNEEIRFSHPNKGIDLSFSVKVSNNEPARWVHLAVSYDGATLRGYADGIEKFNSSQTGMRVSINTFIIGADKTGNNCFVGQIDEVRLWNRECNATELRSRSQVRLTGSELGLVSYWSFDEGEGRTVFDQCGAAVDLDLRENASFVTSDCPIGTSTAIRRNSFSIAGRQTAGGVNACYYFQQERVTTGYDQAAKPMKKQARVMLTFGTNKDNQNASDPAIAVLDVGVSKYGRLAQLPDSLSLPSIKLPSSLNNFIVVQALDILIARYRAEITRREILRDHPDLAGPYYGRIHSEGGETLGSH